MVYKTLVIDPPWKLCTGGSKSLAPQNYYLLQSQEEIKKTLSEWLKNHLIAPEAHLYLWSINSFSAGRSRGIFDALDLCEYLGFKPITLLPWIKDNSNPTPYGQRQTEMILFGSRHRKGHHKRVMYRGSETESAAQSTLSSSVDFIQAKRGSHSTKPDLFYSYVESRSCAPYLELYARKKRIGWTTLGNEVTRSL